MIQSQSRYQEGGFYRCSFCQKAKNVEETRWWCPVCGYDVCNECSEQDIADLDWPEAVEEELRRCKDKHEFIKSREKTESFVCQKEDTESHGAQYKCLKCGMIQCEKCAGETGIKLDAEEILEKGPAPGRLGYEYEKIDPVEGTTIEMADDGSEEAIPKEEKAVEGGVSVPAAAITGTKKETEGKNCTGPCSCLIL